MKRLVVILIAFFAYTNVKGQLNSWVYFPDKDQSQIKTPENWTSQKSVKRREQLNIPFDYSDIPVNPDYVEKLKKSGYRVVGVSKWLNAACVEGVPGLAELESKDIPAVKVVPLGRYKTVSSSISHETSGAAFSGIPAGVSASAASGDRYAYGFADLQTNMLKLEHLHNKGFDGEGVLICLMDAGFFRVDSLVAFDSLWKNNQILNWYDFVDNDKNIFSEDWHGMSVLSLIGANIPWYMVGTAPKANFLLARTENVYSETHLEEFNWIRGMEWADSQGVHIIHSSLGYSVFDTLEGNYTYADMDGNTTIITRAADFAASKGILVTNSAGNEGAGPWHFITAPCDGDSVLCIGAVDSFMVHAPFSSFGPSSDGQVKPDVMAMGSRVTTIRPDGAIRFGSGTSFSGPIIAGFAACLKQAHPTRSNMEIIEAIRRSADRYETPDTAYGFGIPDAQKADSILTHMPVSVSRQIQVNKSLRIFPNPSRNSISIEGFAGNAGKASLVILNLLGQEVVRRDLDLTGNGELKVDVSGFPDGIYMVSIQSASDRYSGKLMVR